MTKTISGFNGSVTFDQFDASLGTLTSVVWSLTGTWTTSGSVTNNGDEDEFGFVQTTVTPFFSSTAPFVGLTPGAAIAESTPFELAAGQTVDIESFTTLMTRGNTQTTDLASWIGGSTVGFSVNSSRGSSFQSFGDGEQEIQLGLVTTGNYQVTLAYNYEPASVIPLPAAGWMLLSGIFGLGGLGWMRRRAA